MKIISTSVATLVATLAAALTVGIVGPALAASPHFVSTSAELSGSNVVVSFKEAGLGSQTVVTIQAEAAYTAVFACINGGGHNPSAANKSTVTGSATKSGTFTSGKNGQVTGSLTVAAPSVADNDLTCPSGQRETLTALSWSSVRVSDLTSGATSAVLTR